MKNTYLMIDTNVILDAFLDRDPFAEDSKEVLRKCANREIRACVCPNTITDLYYIYHKFCKDKDKTYDMLDKLLKVVTVVPLMGIDILRAKDLRNKDFEDTVIAIAASASKCKAIISRNKSDYTNFDIDTYTPNEMLQMLN